MRHVDSPLEKNRLPCGCFLKMAPYPAYQQKWTFCPLHANAADLLDICKLLVACGAYDFKEKVLDRAQDIIAMAEAKPEKETTE